MIIIFKNTYQYQNYLVIYLLIIRKLLREKFGKRKKIIHILIKDKNKNEIKQTLVLSLLLILIVKT